MEPTSSRTEKRPADLGPRRHILRWIAAAVAVVAAGLATAQPYGYPYGPPPGPYGYGPPAFVVRCESNNWQQNFCPLDMRNVQHVQVVRQFSGRACVQGNSWNSDQRGIWVTDGCRAAFAVTLRPPRAGDPTAPGPAPGGHWANGRYYYGGGSPGGPPPSNAYGPPPDRDGQPPSDRPQDGDGQQSTYGPQDGNGQPQDQSSSRYPQDQNSDDPHGTVTVRDDDGSGNGDRANQDNGTVNGNPPVDANGYPIDQNGNRIPDNPGQPQR